MRWDATLRAGGRAALIVFGVVLGLLALAGLGLEWLRGDEGRAFVVAQVGRITPHSGLRVSVGRIEGNPARAFVAHDVVLSDPAGPFLTIPTLSVDWRPFRFADNQLVIRALDAPRARLLRMPSFLPALDPNQPLLPKFDILIEHLRVNRLVVDPAVAGRAATVALSGRADVAGGQAVVRADARSTVGDMLALDLDSRPDDDKFKLKARLDAPTGSLAGGIAGLQRGGSIAIDGAGSWTQWRGALDARIGGASLARLALSADGGRFAAHGRVMPATLTGPGMIATLAGPSLALDATAAMTDGQLRLDTRLAGAALSARAAGPIDLRRGTIEQLGVTGRLARPELLSATLAGTPPIDFSATLNGPLRALAIVAEAHAASLRAGAATLIEPRAGLRLTLDRGPLMGIVRLTVVRATGLGPELDPLAKGIVVDGPITLANGLFRANAIAVQTTRATARASGSYALATGAYLANIDGALPGYAIAGVGVADLSAQVRLAPGAGGRGMLVSGPVSARFVRLESGAAHSLAGGLPIVSARADLGAGGAVRLDGLLIAAPALRLAGSAALAPGGVISARLAGQSVQYGPVELIASGTTAKPALDLALARPGFGVGLANVRASVRPGAGGYAIVAHGASNYGAFVADLGLTTTGGIAIDVRAFTLAGISAHGHIAPAGPVYAGDLVVSGQGLNGTVHLADQAGVQRADLALTLIKARLLPIDRTLAIGHGRIVATVLLPTAGPEGSATADLAQVTRGTVTITRLTARGQYARGAGTAHGALAGQANAPFTLAADVGLTPGRVTFAAQGDIDGQPVKLAQPAVLTRAGRGWNLAPATLMIADGRATVSGTINGETRLNARLQGIQLDDLTAVGALNVRGGLSGTADLVIPADGLPQGTAQLFVSRFSRAGLAVSSLPVDIEAAAALKGNAGAVRGYLRRAGKVLGAFQAQLLPIPGAGAGSTADRLLAAPLHGQVRVQGPAEALWPLAGVDALDLRGPVAVDATLGGRLGAPQIAGIVRASGARLEAAVTGTTVTALDMDGRFNGPTLTIASFSGKAGNGTLNGSGRVSYGEVAGLTADLKANLANATMLKTDTLTAAVSGPATIKLDRDGGVIGGDVRIDSARYNIGATPAEQVPVLKVREIGVRPPTGRVVVDDTTQWRLAVHATARSRFNVRGLGLDSDWGADVRISGPATEPRITGRATLARGTYEFSGKTFTLNRGEIRFTGEYPPNPSIDIQATASVTGLTAVLNIGGSAFKPEISFTSTPALPEDEVLSRLLFGSSVTSLSAPEALQLAAAVASLRGGKGVGLNPVNALRRATGLDRLKVQGADQATGRGTSVAAGKYIGRNVYLELATDAKGYTATQIEISLTRWLSVLSTVASQGSNSVSVKVSKDY